MPPLNLNLFNRVLIFSFPLALASTASFLKLATRFFLVHWLRGANKFQLFIKNSRNLQFLEYQQIV